MDKNKLKAEYPAMYGEIMQEGKAEAEKGSDERIKAAVENVLGLIGAVADPETATKIKTLHDAGIGASQAEAMKAIFGTAAKAPESSGASADAESRKEILDAIKGATPGAVAGDPKKATEDTFDSLVAAELAAGKSKAEAMKTVQKARPDLHEKWMLDQQEAK